MRFSFSRPGWLGTLAVTPVLLVLELVYLASVLVYGLGTVLVTSVHYVSESLEQYGGVARNPLRPSRLQAGLERHLPMSDRWQPPRH